MAERPMPAFFYLDKPKAYDAQYSTPLQNML